MADSWSPSEITMTGWPPVATGVYVAQDELVYNVKSHGAKGDAVTDDSAAINALLDTIAAKAWGGVLFFPPGSYVLNDGITVPVNRGFRFIGSGIGWRTPQAKITKWVTTRNRTTPMLTAPRSGGASSPDSARTFFELRDIWLDGGSAIGLTAAAALIQCHYGSECLIDRITIRRQAWTAAIFAQLFNSSISRMRVHDSGSPGNPAVVFTSVDGTGTNTVQGFDWQFDGNEGTDLELNGFGLAPCTEIAVHGLKFEGGVGVAEPYLHLAYAEDCVLSGVQIFNHREVAPIHVDHQSLGAGEDRAVILGPGWIDQSNTVPDPPVYVDVNAGNLHMPWMMIRGKPSSAYIAIGAGVRDSAFSHRGWIGTPDGSAPPTYILDSRAGVTNSKLHTYP